MAGRYSRVQEHIRKQMPYEIIEIGAVKLDYKGNILARFQTSIKPVVYTELNRFVAQVTNRGGNSLKFGQAFTDAMKEFYDFCGEDYCFCTWSDSDTKPLKENLAFHNMDDKLAVRVLDVQQAFTSTFEEGGPQRSIEYALDFLRIEKNQPFHQALSDAWYTAKVLREVLFTCEADYQAVALDEIDLVSDKVVLDLMEQNSYNPDINHSAQRQFPVMSAASEVNMALEETQYECPACGRDLDMLVDDEGSSWQKKGRAVESKLMCIEHGLVTARAKPRKNKEGKFFVTVSLRLLRT